MATQVEIDRSVFLPAYHHLLDSDCDINFLWGGRDSGKSHFIAQKLLMDCLALDYFRCILIKKTHESIKDSQWQMLKDIATAWGVSHLFDFNSSPLEIRCANGNKFISRGCDKAGKLKSITNPSHAWYEEGNQLTEDDFTIVTTTLRGECRVQQWFSFNPEAEGVLEEFWLYKNYFKDIKYDCVEYKTTTYTIEGNLVELKYSSTHTTYHVNPHVRPERKAKLEELAILSPYYYDVYCLGRWGKREVKRPYCQNFSKDKHVSTTAIFNPRHPVIFSLDFNVEPFVCEAGHIWSDNTGLHFHNFTELVIEKNGDVPEMCDMIENTFGMRVVSNALFTGDAMQRKREITQRNNIDAWRMIDARLRVGKRMMVPRSNPSVKENRHLINAIHAFHPDFKVNPVCKKLIYDMQFVEADESGDIIKKSRGNEAQRADALDCFVGETMIKTLQGDKRIDSINIGEYVLTRKGYKKVIDKWCSLAAVSEYCFDDGRKIKCTDGHKFYAQHIGFMEILDIFTANIKVWKLPSFTTELNIINTQSKTTTTLIERNITRAACIGKNGLMRMAKYQKGLMCTIRTKMHLIMNWIITNLLSPKNIKDNTVKIDSNGIRSIFQNWLKKEENQPKNGMAQKKANCGTPNTQKRSDSENLNTGKEIVKYVIPNLRQPNRHKDSVQINANQRQDCYQELTTKLENVSHATMNSPLISTRKANIAHENVCLRQTHTELKVLQRNEIGIQKVYDITVEEEHEFYANEILVHNCHRYMCNTFLHDFFERYKMK